MSLCSIWTLSPFHFNFPFLPVPLPVSTLPWLLFLYALPTKASLLEMMCHWVSPNPLSLKSQNIVSPGFYFLFLLQLILFWFCHSYVSGSYAWPLELIWVGGRGQMQEAENFYTVKIHLLTFAVQTFVWLCRTSFKTEAHFTSNNLNMPLKGYIAT